MESQGPKTHLGAKDTLNFVSGALAEITSLFSGRLLETGGVSSVRSLGVSLLLKGSMSVVGVYTWD